MTLLDELTLTSTTEADAPFLSQLYASTRTHELAKFGWNDIQQSQFLALQFNAQRLHYQKAYPDAICLLVRLDGVSVGRLYLDHQAHEVRVVDISLLPEYRGCGLGTRLLSDVVANAHARDKIVSLHVEKHNIALSLYRRLGFNSVEHGDVYLHMVCPVVGSATLPRQ